MRNLVSILTSSNVLVRLACGSVLVLALAGCAGVVASNNQPGMSSDSASERQSAVIIESTGNEQSLANTEPIGAVIAQAEADTIEPTQPPEQPPTADPGGEVEPGGAVVAGEPPKPINPVKPVAAVEDGGAVVVGDAADPGSSAGPGFDPSDFNGDDQAANTEQGEIYIPPQPRLNVSNVSFHRRYQSHSNDCVMTVVVHNGGSVPAENVTVYGKGTELVGAGGQTSGPDVLTGPTVIGAGQDATYFNSWYMGIGQGYPVLHEVSVYIGDRYVAGDSSPYGTVAQPCN